MSKSITDGILGLLRDGQWHNAEEFTTLGKHGMNWSFRNRICELRQVGYKIESERREGHPTFRYRIVTPMVIPNVQLSSSFKFSTSIPKAPIDPQQKMF